MMKLNVVLKEEISETRQYKVILAFNGVAYMASVAEIDEYGEKYETKLSAICKELNAVMDEYEYFKDYYFVA